MTGFGRAEGTWNTRQYRVEIKSLNSKQLDISVRVPLALRDRELQIRTEVGKVLGRGKIDVGVFCDEGGRETKGNLNTELMQAYYTQLKAFCENNGIENTDRLASILRHPRDLRNSALHPVLQDRQTTEGCSIPDAQVMKSRHRDPIKMPCAVPS